jgi:hypothetical protein
MEIGKKENVNIFFMKETEVFPPALSLHSQTFFSLFLSM